MKPSSVAVHSCFTGGRKMRPEKGDKARETEIYFGYFSKGGGGVKVESRGSYDDG